MKIFSTYSVKNRHYNHIFEKTAGLDSGNKKKGILSIVLTGVVIMTMTVFVSCGYKTYETGDEKTSLTRHKLHGPINPEVETDTSTDAASADAAKTYNPEDYGQIAELREEFTGENIEEIIYYYEMENFYVNDTFENADKINDTLQKIYDEYEESYKKDAEVYKGEYVGGEPINTPHNSWHLLNLTFAGNRYISIEYNNIGYMGGAHPYSYFDGITIDCKTGEEVSASELLGKSDEDILKQVCEEMGMDTVASWDEMDYYLTDSTIVFFYRMPNYWEDVIWEWKH